MFTARTNIRACTIRGDYAAAERVFHELLDAGVAPNAAVLRAYLADGLWLTGEGDKAALLFDRLLREGTDSVFAWSAMIRGLARAGKLDEALQLLEQGTARGLTFTSHAFSALLSACGKKAALEIGSRTHQIAQSHKAAHGVEYLTSFLLMLAGSGQLDESRTVFDDLKRRGMANAVSYTAMVSVLARAGNVDEAMTLLDEGTARKLQFDSPLSALCS